MKFNLDNIYNVDCIAKDRLNGISQRDRDIEKKGQIRFDL